MGYELFTLDLIVVTPIFADVWESREAIEFESQRMHVVSHVDLKSLMKCVNLQVHSLKPKN